MHGSHFVNQEQRAHSVVTLGSWPFKDKLGGVAGIPKPALVAHVENDGAHAKALGATGSVELLTKGKLRVGMMRHF